MRTAVVVLSSVILAGRGDAPVEAVNMVVQSDLRDRASARFRNIRQCGSPNVFSGEVNSKNAYGDYTGFATFYAERSQVDLAMEAATDDIVNGLLPEALDRLRRESANSVMSEDELSWSIEADNLATMPDATTSQPAIESSNAEIGREGMGR